MIASLRCCAGNPHRFARGGGGDAGSDAQCVTANEPVVAALDAGTVDIVAGTGWPFAREDQGQEAAVVIYSMATSLAEDVPRGMEFLYPRHRMNVAVSRARCLAILVCSPDLLRVSCSTAARIPLANALCSFVERALVLDAPAAAASRLDLVLL
jgi:hypothetical protein